MAAAVLISGWLVQTDAFKVATTRQADGFTELYFKDPARLPKQIVAGKRYNDSFVITNRESTPQTYAYEVTVASGGKSSQKLGQVTVGPGKQATLPFTYGLSAPKRTANITIQLLNTSQAIHFRVAS